MDHMHLLIDTDEAENEIREQIDRWEKLKINYTLSMDRQNAVWQEHINHGRRSTVKLLQEIFPTSKQEESFLEIFGEFFTDNPSIEKIINEVIQNLNDVLDNLKNYDGPADSFENKTSIKKNRLSNLFIKFFKRGKDGV